MSHLPSPPPCLPFNLPVMEKQSSSELNMTRLGFPNEFPYEFESPAFSPGFTSPGDSTETEEESSDDEEDFLAQLNRRLAPSTHRLPPPNSVNVKPEEKRQVTATSPQSTLSGLGSFSTNGSKVQNFQPPQPQTTSFQRDNAWDVISAAAGEVARLKLECFETHLHRQNSESLLRRKYAALEAEHFLQQHRLLDQMWLCSQSRIKSSESYFPNRVLDQEVAFENIRYMRHNASSNATWQPHHAAAPLKRPSTGTGVFLPRKYPTTTPSDSYRKTGTVNTTAMLHSKVNPQHLMFNEFASGGPRRIQFEHEYMLARSKQAAHQDSFRSVTCLNQERRLPQDWMY